MSNIYIQEPPALGKVLLKTSAGEIDIELWTKEAPKACRNFIQLCMEGYYVGTIFHRVVPGFIVQGGDPNGNGTGGESIYGAPFKDEFHSRLRFNRRGLVGSANAGKDDNASQFFFTLAATPELQNKHTIFGKVTGETIYNVLKLSEGLIGPDDRPEHPHKITATTVLINPFTDIVPRIQEAVVEVAPKKKKEIVGVKNFGLLSFGDEAEEDEEEVQVYRGKPKSTHDLLEDPKLSKLTAEELEQQQQTTLEPTTEEIEKQKKKTEVAVTNIRDKLTSKKRESSTERDGKRKKDGNEGRDSKKKRDSSKKRDESEERDRNKKRDASAEREGDGDSSGEEYYLGKDRDKEIKKEKERVRNEIKQLKKEMKGNKEEKLKDEQNEVEIAKKIDEDNELMKSYVEEQERYKKMKEKIPKKGAARENFTLQLLSKFKDKLKGIKEKSTEETEGESSEKKEEKKEKEEDDLNSDDWLGHKLRFEDQMPVLARDASSKGDDWFDIYDPRNPINQRKREKGRDSKKERHK